jgi:Cu/Ag efflux pump CusA
MNIAPTILEFVGLLTIGGALAFIFGVVPLVAAQGARAEMRRALGLAVFAGMLGATLFGIFLTPVFFYVIRAVSDRRAGHFSAAKEPL